LQPEGKGIQPIFIDATSSPHPSSLALFHINDDKIEALYDDSIGDGVFKIEWVRRVSMFGTGTKALFALSSTLEDDMHGYFQINVCLTSVDEVETSVPIYLDEDMSIQSLMVALENIKSIGSVVVSDLSVSKESVSWVVLLRQDMGSIGTFSLVTDGLKSTSGAGQVHADIQ
jgi:hypothetical protein